MTGVTADLIFRSVEFAEHPHLACQELDLKAQEVKFRLNASHPFFETFGACDAAETVCLQPLSFVFSGHNCCCHVGVQVCREPVEQRRSTACIDPFEKLFNRDQPGFRGGRVTLGWATRSWPKRISCRGLRYRTQHLVELSSAEGGALCCQHILPNGEPHQSIMSFFLSIIAPAHLRHRDKSCGNGKKPSCKRFPFQIVKTFIQHQRKHKADGRHKHVPSNWFSLTHFAPVSLTSAHFHSYPLQGSVS